MISSYSRRVGASYAGLAPVFVAAGIGAVLTWIAWPLLARTTIYPDVIAGETTWANVDKARDFRALYLFFAITVFLSLVLAGFFRRRRLKKGPNDPEGDSALLRMLLISATLPALWSLAVALAAPLDANYLMSWTKLDAVVRAGAVIVALAFAWRRRSPTAGPYRARERVRKIGIPLVTAMLGAFAGLGIATAIGRLVPSVGLRLTGGASLFAIAGGAIAFAIATLIGRQARQSNAEYRGRLRGLFMALQLPLPLLFFLLVPAPLLHGSRIVEGGHRTALALALLALASLAWVLLWRRHRSARKESTDQTADLDVSIERWLSPLCMAAIALFVAIPSLPAPALAIHPHHLHFGERALPWQQWVAWGKVPYVDFIPIHGLMPLTRGFFNWIFFDNAAPGFVAAALLVAGIFTVTLFLAARPLISTPLALAVAAFSLPVVMSDRFFFFTPALLVLVHPGLLARPLRWLVVWLVVVPLLTLYNAPIGMALAIGTLPAALAMAYRLARADVRKFIGLLILAGSATAILLFIPNVYAIARGFFQYVRENQTVNNVANGIAWEQSFHSPRSPSGFLRQGVWGLSRLSWIAVVLIALQLGWRELARPPDQRRQSLLWLTTLFVPTFLIAAQWALGRIDPGGSRLDTLSYISLFQILPVLLLLARPLSARSMWVGPSLGLALVMVTSLAGPHGLARAFLGHNALQPRLVFRTRGLVRGEELGMPNVGIVMRNQTVDDAHALKTALAPLLRPGETYLNLGLASDFYYYLDLPVPTIYAETLVPASGAMQARMLRQIAADPPPVALASPWEVQSVRDYYLYRDYLLRYPAIRRGRFVLLVDAARAPDAGPIGSDEQIAMLDSIYRIPRLEKIPSAWGGSWRTLAPRFTRVVALNHDRIRRVQSVIPEAQGTWRVSSELPSFEYALTDLNLRGRDADFLKLDFVAAPGAELRVSWAAGGRPMGKPIAITPSPETATLLIPLGATPSWLLSARVDSLRLEVAGRAAAPGMRFTIRNVLLLHLNPPR